jgi:hypothetical protein
MANIVPSRYRPKPGHVVVPLLVVAFGCSRTGLDDLTGTPLTPYGSDETPLADATTPTATSSAREPPLPSSTAPAPRCSPMPEACNGIDDDCNGKVDDGIAPVACSGGGSRYCVAGRLSACPTRCDACVPDSERVCFHSYCTYWAVEACTADGKSFGICRERHVPAECTDIANRHQDSLELEQCCIDNGYCCHDEFDLDHDGNRNEMLGTCDEVSCHS